MTKSVWFLVIGIFMLGWFASDIYAYLSYDDFAIFPMAIFSDHSPDIDSPSDWIKEEQIHVYKDRIILDIEDAVWSTFADTNSMDPFLDAGSNGLEIRPEYAEQIMVGDVISYRSDYAPGIVIHRVTDKGQDEDGIFYRVKGDNNALRDPGKIRFNQIEGVLVGILY